MQVRYSSLLFSLIVSCIFAWQPAYAKLPPPTPQQAQATAAQKAKADADAEKAKQELSASMDEVTARWRTRAAANGWPTHPATPVQPAKGINAPTLQSSSSSGQPSGQQGNVAQQLPIRSEKAGTAPPSTDVKKPKPNDKAQAKQ